MFINSSNHRPLTVLWASDVVTFKHQIWMWIGDMKLKPQTPALDLSKLNQKNRTNWKQGAMLSSAVWTATSAISSLLFAGITISSTITHIQYTHTDTHTHTHTHTHTPHQHQQHQQRQGLDWAGWSQLVPANTFHCTLMTAGPPASVTLALTPLHGPPGIPQGQEGWGGGGRTEEEEEEGGRSDTDEGGHSRWWDSSEGIGSHEYINWQEGE